MHARPTKEVMNTTKRSYVGLAAVPMGQALLHETLDLAGESVIRAALDCIHVGQVTGAHAAPAPLGRGPRARGRSPASQALKWPALEAHFLAHSLLLRRRRSEPDAGVFSSQAALTLAQVCWRMAHDAAVKQQVRLLGHQPSASSDELADHAVAIVASCVLGDGVREMRQSIQRASQQPWTSADPAKVMWHVYTSFDGPRLMPRLAAVIAGLGPNPPKLPAGRRGASRELVERYEPAAIDSLTRRVTDVTLGWCANNPAVMADAIHLRQARNWSAAAMVQLKIWLTAADSCSSGSLPW